MAVLSASNRWPRVVQVYAHETEQGASGGTVPVSVHYLPGGRHDSGNHCPGGRDCRYRRRPDREPLGFGAMRITGEGIWGDPPDREEAKRVLRASR